MISAINSTKEVIILTPLEEKINEAKKFINEANGILEDMPKIDLSSLEMYLSPNQLELWNNLYNEDIPKTTKYLEEDIVTGEIYILDDTMDALYGYLKAVKFFLEIVNNGENAAIKNTSDLVREKIKNIY